MFDHSALHIYTDGSSYSSPRRGGVGIRFVFPENINKEELDFDIDGYKQASNNQMEIKACIIALQRVSSIISELGQVSRIIIHTDSRYVVDNFKRAICEWQIKHWKRKDGAPVLNTELWKELIREYKKIPKRVEIEWIKGHSKDIHNKAVDKLAKQSAKKATNKMPILVNVRRKITDKSVEIGSVKMLGQVLSIRIITSEYLKSPHKIWKYKYEVISPESEFYKNVDIIYCHEPLRQRYSYTVGLNNNNDYPQILEVLSKERIQKRWDEDESIEE